MLYEVITDPAEERPEDQGDAHLEPGASLLRKHFLHEAGGDDRRQQDERRQQQPAASYNFV